MIVVFDAQCLLCNAWVRFLLKHDRSKQIRFASIQNNAGKKLLAEAGLKIDRLETLLVIDNGLSWQHTSAIMRVLCSLGWPWKLAGLGYAVPTPIRDMAYRLIARNRYKLFGRTETCLMPSGEHAHRFL
jgi:predicted DCC family thiol-disulfide oxidoreductase YuxK